MTRLLLAALGAAVHCVGVPEAWAACAQPQKVEIFKAHTARVAIGSVETSRAEGRKLDVAAARVSKLAVAGVPTPKIVAPAIKGAKVPFASE